ncbi:MAG: histidine phosphatase family protein [Oscillospiraceae bacterium]|nr:histidine phosphatase family protein [Oscillospiraceae bacterium]
MKIFVTRHGQTDWNVERKVQGLSDNPLNSVGIQQAKIAKEQLDQEEIDLIISSPLLRAKKTAEIINEGRNIPILFDERLVERKFGVLEGKNINDCNFYEICTSEKDFGQGIETRKTFSDRIFEFLDEVKKEYTGKNILLVTHGGTSIAINCYFNGFLANEDLAKLGLKNCEVIKFEVEE